MRRLEAALLLDAQAVLAEGPRWDAAAGRLLWVDIPGRAVHVSTLDGADERYDADVRITAVAPTTPGRPLLCATEGGLAWLELREGRAHLDPIVDLGLPDGVRLNDGACDPAGRFWFGSMHEESEPGRGALWSFDGADPRVQLADVGLSNGLGWSPDGTSMAYVDTLSHHVDRIAFDVDAGSLGDRAHLAAVDSDEGVPDGLAVDVEGGIWVAVFGGGKVIGFDPDGSRRCEVTVPAAQVTACCFAGPAGDRLVITTASEGLDADQRRAQPHAGGLFVADVGVTGPPAQPFIARG